MFETGDIKLKGWVTNIREQKNVSFIILRLLSGSLLQCVDKNTSYIKIKLGSYVEISGKIVNRNLKNKNINDMSELSLIECLISDIKIISKVYNSLPFNINKLNYSNYESIKYRPLVLRNRDSSAFKALLYRSEIERTLRNTMNEMGFIEIKTPIITKPANTGANEFLLRIKGKIFALAQSPQLYKQLLMIGGIEKYFQIAPCFRFEDHRSDRTVGEFYQLDFELNSIDSFEEIINITDKIIFPLISKNIIEYRKIKYKDAIRIFGTDKPDLRLEGIIKKNKNDCITVMLKDIRDTEAEVKLLGISNSFYIHDEIAGTKDKSLNKLFINSIASLFRHKLKGHSYVWVIDFPMYSESGDFLHHPFSIIKDKKNLICDQADLVINGIEVGGGSIRNYNLKSLRKIINDNSLKEFLNHFKFGVPPHGGFAIGIERLIMSIKNFSIQDICTFPMLNNWDNPLLGNRFRIRKKNY